MIFKTSIELIACVCILLTPAISKPIESNSQFQLEYRDGTLITSEFIGSTLMWTDVTEFGQMKKQPIDVARIVSLTLTKEPASNQLSDIFKLIAQLDSEDFFTREEAEQQLRRTGKRFRSLIAKYDTLETMDGNYRLKRVLSSMRVSSKSKSEITLDVLTLDDGTKLTGDAGNENLQFSINGKTVEVDRKNLAKISRANGKLVTRPELRSFVETKLFHDHEPFMQGRDLKLVDFEHRPDGTPLSELEKNITGQFVDFGLVLGTEFPMGCVGVSGKFEVEGGDKPTGGNSVCVYQSKLRLRNRFQGVMEITFCQPGKQNIPHGVKDFGLFIANVNHSRDVLVEAYDSMDRLIGICESNDEPCTFCGISSSIPIARIRVLSNPWVLTARRIALEAMKRSELPADKALLMEKKFISSMVKVDGDFAVDSIMYSAPVPIDSVRKERHFFSRNGDMIVANWMRVFDSERIELNSRFIDLMSVNLSQANTVALRATPKMSSLQMKSRRTWMAMLRDNSMLEWDPASPLRSATLKQDLSRDDVIAIWPSEKRPHMPLSGDFDSGKNVLVYPGCRIATPAVELSKSGFRWTGGTVRMEDLHEVNDKKVAQRKIDVPDRVVPRKAVAVVTPDADPGEAVYSFDTKLLAEFETPTIWFEKPTSMLASQGALRLDNGEVLVYGPDSLTELKSLDRKQVVLTFRGNEVVIPISKIISISPPLQ